MVQVPQPSFNATDYGSMPDASNICYVRRNNLMDKLIFDTASSGEPVSFSSRYQNETYHLDFHGPALRCSMADVSVVVNITHKFGTDVRDGASTYPFVSWVAGDEGTLNHTGNTSLFQTFDVVSHDAARIFVMTTRANRMKLQSSMVTTTQWVTSQNVSSTTHHTVSTSRSTIQTRHI